jgi:hypothetical protein
MFDMVDTFANASSELVVLMNFAHGRSSLQIESRRLDVMVSYRLLTPRVHFCPQPVQVLHS